MRARGFAVIRVTNEDVLRNLNGVVLTVLEATGR